MLRSAIFTKFKHEFTDSLGNESQSTTITVMTAIKYTTENLETGEGDTEQIRCDTSFMGSPWQDGVVFIEANELAGRLQKHPVTTTQTKLRLDFYPDADRRFGIVHLIFELNGGLWLLLEVLEGAEKGKKPAWQSSVIPNWAHLQTKSTKNGAPCALSNRLQVTPLECVERVRVIAEDPNHPKEGTVRGYWCPVEGDCVPFDEVFYNSSRYELHGDLNLNEQGHPAQLFEDAISVQPWELCPPSRRSMPRSTQERNYSSSSTVALPLEVQRTAASEAQ